MQPNINNVICIVYEELKSNMKGVLLYVVHPADTPLLRDDFRIAKQASILKGIENQIIVDKHVPENNRVFSPTTQNLNDIYLNGKLNRQQSPRRVLYVRDNEIGTNRDFTQLTAGVVVPPPSSLPQLSYAPFKGSYHSSRDNSGHRRHRSPKKTKPTHGSSKTPTDDGTKQLAKYRSRSPPKQSEPALPATSKSNELVQEQPDQQQQQQQAMALQQQQQMMAAWQAAQAAPAMPMGVYNRLE